jgi:hypothetical protein
MLRVISRIILVVPLCAAAVFAGAQTKLYTPKAGSAERKAIMDALRVPVEKELKKKTIFKVQHLKVQKEWAFMRGTPRQSNGRPMDYHGTVYQEAIGQGAFDDGIAALLHKKRGKWTVTTYRIGSTDVAWDGWDRQYKAPSAIFK